MEQRSVSSEVSEVSDIYDKIVEKAGEVRDKREYKLKVLQDDSKALRNLLESLTERDDQDNSPEMQSVEAQLASLTRDFEGLMGHSAAMREKVHQAKQAVEALQDQRVKQKKQAVQPRSRYSVNVFRDMSNVNWQQEQGSNELKGFVRNKRGVKTFCFDKEKQSSFFIANNLWEMGEDESDDEAVRRGIEKAGVKS